MTIYEIVNSEFIEIVDYFAPAVDVDDDRLYIEAVWKYCVQSILDAIDYDGVLEQKYNNDQRIRAAATKRTIKALKVIHKDWPTPEEPKQKSTPKKHPTAGEVCISVAIRDNSGTLRDAVYNSRENRWQIG